MGTSVSIVVVNWNGRRHLERCLPSLLSQTLQPEQIVVVDNGSTDGSVEWVRRFFPDVDLVENDSNRGFAAANNQALAAARSEFIATLNNDAWAEPEWLAELIRAMRGEPKVGMCSSKMLFADRPHVVNSTGISLDWAGIAWDRHGGEPNDNQEREPVEIFGPCAGAALYRMAMLEELGGFDEDFFAYLEDVDLAWRAQLAGWRCLYVPRAVVHHHHSGTGVEGSPFKNYLLGRNKIWLIVKNYPMPHLLKYLPIVALYDAAALPYSLIVRGDCSAVRGRWAGLRQVRAAWQKRKNIQSSIQDSHHWTALMHPIESPWKVHCRYRHLRPEDSMGREKEHDSADSLGGAKR